jgi:Fur family transcriptional regulator, ferric uptake regulator
VSFIERASEAIHAAGGRMTPQRQTIIELLASAAERLDAEALYQLARQQDHAINLATVYRTLNTLEAAGLIREQYISPEHERKYYTLAAETYHFTCRKCHRVIAFTSDVLDDLKDRLKTDLHVTAFNVCLCVDGLCADCQAEERAAGKELAR